MHNYRRDDPVRGANLPGKWIGNASFKINACPKDARTVSLHCAVQTLSRPGGFLQNGFQGLFIHTGNKVKET